MKPASETGTMDVPLEWQMIVSAAKRACASRLFVTITPLWRATAPACKSTPSAANTVMTRLNAYSADSTASGIVFPTAPLHNTVRNNNAARV